MPRLTGAEQRRIQPKLRMIRNGDAVVNALRSEHSPSVSVSETATTRQSQNRPKVSPHLQLPPGQ